LTDAIGRGVATTGLTPNQVTILSALLAVPTAILLWKGPLVWGALAMGVVASLDFVDGALARVTGRTTLAGGYLDSLLDRFVDALMVIPLLLRTDTTATWLAGSAFLVGMTVTSFARARVYQDIDPPASAWRRDLLERPERYFILAPGVLAQGILDASGRHVDVLLWVLAALAVLSFITVVQRMATAWRLLREADAAR
jgi:phosphatidylglycerophosphate synthase